MNLLAEAKTIYVHVDGTFEVLYAPNFSTSRLQFI